ncbi:MAG: 1-(5-phosphoribosyl)-5-[(5-phosphoribosylamino)methylideneamino]imidazole-4-carboxamide isomerase [Erysipelotrichaceae bacterium]|nr:1-(5-phosphoribosyl)-5-[(5-phosphoribosylamino)methylideneamino]imidazole-4-carboxamide isomerase [Erysipelotrichaceae bacterium]
MLIFPAIDIYNGEAVRLLHGDYLQKVVYSDGPLKTALTMKQEGAEYLHIVDLNGAENGEASNRDLIIKIKKETGLFIETGGGIRSKDTLESYLNNGIDRVILGSAAITDHDFLEQCVKEYGERIAVSVDLLNDKVAIHGWKSFGEDDADSFCAYLQKIGIKTMICTDISRDGAMRGTNLELYKRLSETYSIDLIASGGVSSIDDIKALKAMDIYGAIIGKAYYTKAIDLKEALEVTYDK